ncbi:MAG: hypothetical protein AAGM38_03690, partial [Pseudomonadota bacterium]
MTTRDEPTGAASGASSANSIAYVRTEPAPLLPPPASEVGVIGWLKRNVFASMSNFSTPGASAQSIAMIVLTIAVGYFGVAQIYALLNFALFDAVWLDSEGVKRLACATELQGGALPADWFGACYPFISDKWKFLVYGAYPTDEIWRVNLVFLLGALGIAVLVAESVPHRFWVGVGLLAAAIGYGFLVVELFGEPFGVRVGVQILAGVGLLYIASGAAPQSDLFSSGALSVFKLAALGAAIALGVAACFIKVPDDMTIGQQLMLKVPVIALFAAIALAPLRWVGVLMLTAFPAIAFVLLTGAALEVDEFTLAKFAAVAVGLIAFGALSRRGRPRPGQPRRTASRRSARERVC